MEEYKLYLGEYPESRTFDRVHAMLMTSDGRVLLRYKEGEPRVTGGRIDSGDQDLESALKREVQEELNCKIDKCDYLGYIAATDAQTYERENWARMVARASKIGTPMPDPDRAGNWIYGRELVTPEIARERLARIEVFGDNNVQVLDAALKVAREKHYFSEPQNEHCEVINVESRQDS